MNSKKTLILIRHAHRDTDDRTRDNGLSDKGQAQVKKLTHFAMKRLKSSEFEGIDEKNNRPLLFSSPKKRCQETMVMLAKELKLKVEVEPRVDEHHLLESHEGMIERIRAFLEHWEKKGPQVTIVCSHGDWIPMAIQLLTGVKVGIKKSGWIEIENAYGEMMLTWMVQKHE